MLKEKTKILMITLLVVISFLSGILFNNYMAQVSYEKLLLEIEELEEEEGLLTTHTPISCNGLQSFLRNYHSLETPYP